MQYGKILGEIHETKLAIAHKIETLKFAPNMDNSNLQNLVKDALVHNQDKLTLREELAALEILEPIISELAQQEADAEAEAIAEKKRAIRAKEENRLLTEIDKMESSPEQADLLAELADLV